MQHLLSVLLNRRQIHHPQVPVKFLQKLKTGDKRISLHQRKVLIELTRKIQTNLDFLQSLSKRFIEYPNPKIIKKEGQLTTNLSSTKIKALILQTMPVITQTMTTVINTQEQATALADQPQLTHFTNQSKTGNRRAKEDMVQPITAISIVNAQV